MQNVTTTRRRPLGISIIAILLFIQAIFGIVGGIFSFLGRLITNPLAGLLVGWIPLAIGLHNGPLCQDTKKGKMKVSCF